MIIGSGLIAKSFLQSNLGGNVILFASGVSNSSEIDDASFNREKDLLLNSISQYKKLIYFSTCSVYDKDLVASPYVIHKKNMEQLILERCSDFAIFRLPQAVGFTQNPKVLINYLAKSINESLHFNLYKFAYRNIIDVDDVKKIVLASLGDVKNEIFNIVAPQSVLVSDIVHILEHTLQKKGIYTLVERGGYYNLDFAFSVFWAKKIGIDFGNNYVERVIKKYYG